jgi:hypothetical protein
MGRHEKHLKCILPGQRKTIKSPTSKMAGEMYNIQEEFALSGMLAEVEPCL